MATFADRLKELRLNSGMSRKELADRCDMSHQSIRDYEQGLRLPSVVHLVKLANALNVTLDTFVAGVDWDARKQPEPENDE